jgi:hypothetical protein
MAYDERKDELGRPRGVYEGTPGEEREGQGPSSRGVYPGTPERPGQAGGAGIPSEGADYGPLGWADVPGQPQPKVEGAQDGTEDPTEPVPDRKDYNP